MAMRISLPRLGVRGSRARQGSRLAWQDVDRRALKEERIDAARERVFGPQGSMPGDRYFRKPLEGHDFVNWYFPSKYNLQDFRVDEYFEMQAERFAPREAHRCIPELEGTLERVSQKREELRAFFQGLDEATFLDNPTLQDLYGLFRLVDPDPALCFTPPDTVFRDHSPLCGADPPFRAASGGPASAAPSPEHLDTDPGADGAADLHALLDVVKAKVGQTEGLALEARLTRLQSIEEIREVLLSEAAKHQVVMPISQNTMVFEQAVQAAASSAGKSADVGDAEKADSSVAEERAHEEDSEDRQDIEDFEDSLDTEDSLDEKLDDEVVRASSSKALVHKAQEEEHRTTEVSRAYMAVYTTRPEHGDGLEAEQAKAEKELKDLRTKGSRSGYLARRHRFVDPMYRRRRLKWIERQYAGQNKATEVKFNSYYVTHPDKTKEWPTNKGSVTVKWPSPYH